MAVSGGAGLLEDFVDAGDGLDGGDGALELGGAGDVEGDGDVGDVVDVVAGDVVHVEALLLGDAVDDVVVNEFATLNTDATARVTFVQ